MIHVLLVEPQNDAYDGSALHQPLGGSETVFLFLSKELAQRPDIELEVFFRDSGDFGAFVQGKNYDLVMAYRHPASLFQVRGRWNLVWLQDLPNQEILPLLAVLKQQGRVDKLVFLSHFQKEMYLRALPGYEEGRHTLMAENPIDLGFFDSTIAKEPAFIYASAPNRGLDILLDVWPAIHEKLPEWELRIAGSVSMYNVGNQSDNPERETLLAEGHELYAQADKMAGIRVLGGLNHAELIKELEKASGLLYPSTWPETSCHVLNCALHSGAVPFVSAAGALAEKVTNGENGIAILGDPHSEQFKQAYTKAVIEAVETGRIERMVRLNRGMYHGWGVERIVDWLLLDTLGLEGYEGLNQRILAVTCSLSDRGNLARSNFANLRWYAPIDVITDEIVGLPIDQARNAACGMAWMIDADWLLFLDDDIFVDSYFIPRMLERAHNHQADVVVACYAYKDNASLLPTARVVKKASNRAIDVWANELSEEEINNPDYHFVTAGVGALLISRKALEEIGRPWFRTQGTMRGKHTGEDSYFFRMCHLCGLKVWLALDEPTVHCDSSGRFFGRPQDIELIRPQLRGRIAG